MNAKALDGYKGSKKQQYASLKLSGMREAPIQLAIYTLGAQSMIQLFQLLLYFGLQLEVLGWVWDGYQYLILSD